MIILKPFNVFLNLLYIKRKKKFIDNIKEYYKIYNINVNKNIFYILYIKIKF